MATEILYPKENFSQKHKQFENPTAQNAYQMRGPWFLTAMPDENYLAGLARITRNNLTNLVAGETVHLGILTTLATPTENDPINQLEREMAHVRQELERVIGPISGNKEVAELVKSGQVKLYSVIETTKAGGMGRLVIPYRVEIQENNTLEPVNPHIAIKLLFPDTLGAIDSETLITRIPDISISSSFVASTFVTQGVLCQSADAKCISTQGIFMDRVVGTDGQTRECSRILSNPSAEEYNLTFLCDMLLAATNAMAHIHSRGLTHGDFGEKQILTYNDETGTPQFRLSDFGDLAKPIGTVVSADKVAGSLDNIDLRLALGIVLSSNNNIYKHSKKLTPQEEQYPLVFPLLRFFPSLRTILDETLKTEMDSSIVKFRAVSECIEKIRKLIVTNKRKLIDSYSVLYQCNENAIERLLDTIVIMSSKCLKTRFDSLAPVRVALENFKQAIESQSEINRRNLFTLIESNNSLFPRGEELNNALYRLPDNQDDTLAIDSESNSEIICFDDLAEQEPISEGVPDAEVQNLLHEVMEQTGLSMNVTVIDQASQALLSETQGSTVVDLHHVEKITGSAAPDATTPKQDWKWFNLNSTNLQYELVCDANPASTRPAQTMKHKSLVPLLVAGGIGLCGGIVAVTYTPLSSSNQQIPISTATSPPSTPIPEKTPNKATISQTTTNEINNFKWGSIAEGAIQEFSLTTSDNQSYGTLYVKRGTNETSEYFQCSIKIRDSIATYTPTKTPKKTIFNLLNKSSEECTFQEKELNSHIITYFIRNGEVANNTRFVFPGCIESGLSTNFWAEIQQETGQPLTVTYGVNPSNASELVDKPRQAICAEAKLAYPGLQINCAEASLGWKPVTTQTLSQTTRSIQSLTKSTQLITEALPFTGSPRIAASTIATQEFTMTVTTGTGIFGQTDNRKTEAARIKTEITDFFTGTQCSNGKNCTAILTINKNSQQYTIEVKKVGLEISFNGKVIKSAPKALETEIITFIKDNTK